MKHQKRARTHLALIRAQLVMRISVCTACSPMGGGDRSWARGHSIRKQKNEILQGNETTLTLQIAMKNETRTKTAKARKSNPLPFEKCAAQQVSFLTCAQQCHRTHQSLFPANFYTMATTVDLNEGGGKVEAAPGLTSTLKVVRPLVDAKGIAFPRVRPATDDKSTLRAFHRACLTFWSRNACVENAALKA